MKKISKRLSLLLAGIFAVGSFVPCMSDPRATDAEGQDRTGTGFFAQPAYAAEKKKDEIVLRVCNWEEYIDLGDWSEEEAIELDNGKTILGENAMINDFEQWYEETYGKKVRVEYSCFGTNEDLYNQLTLGDVYDLVCPSDYMIMKLMQEGELVAFSKDFFNEEDENNFYTRGVSPYIKNVFETNEIGGEPWSKYAAGYMWGVTGMLYNPEYVTDEEAASISMLTNEKFKRRLTLKDNVRDSYFAILSMIKGDKLLSESFVNDKDYGKKLAEVMNDTSKKTIDEVQESLQDLMDNLYSFETDSGKADMVSGKIVANYQWSGDAVYAMDQADELGVELRFQVPAECTNLWFDGWCMLKKGIDGDKDKQHAAESFVNFISRSDNAVRNMYYIGYTSVIAGEEGDDTMIDYARYNYEAEEDEEETAEYPLGYFFSGDADDEDYIIEYPASEQYRQLYSQYPPMEVIGRSAIMEYFDEEATRNINQMWINVRCFNIKDIPAYAYAVGGVMGLVVILILAERKKNKL